MCVEGDIVAHAEAFGSGDDKVNQGSRMGGLRHAIAYLSDDDLAEILADNERVLAASQARELEDTLFEWLYGNFMFRHEVVAQTVRQTNTTGGQSGREKPVSLYVALWINYERLMFGATQRDAMTEQLKVMAHPEHLREMTEADYSHMFSMMVRLFAVWQEDAYRSHCQRIEHFDIVKTAIHVEQYRRKHGALPETLDALVPEFMERVPHSFVSGEPFVYEKGELALFPEDPDRAEETFTGFRVTGGKYHRRSYSLSYEVPLPAEK